MVWNEASRDVIRMLEQASRESFSVRTYLSTLRRNEMGCAPRPATRCSGCAAIEPYALSRRRPQFLLPFLRERDGSAERKNSDESDNETGDDSDSGRDSPRKSSSSFHTVSTSIPSHPNTSSTGIPSAPPPSGVDPGPAQPPTAAVTITAISTTTSTATTTSAATTTSTATTAPTALSSNPTSEQSNITLSSVLSMSTAASTTASSSSQTPTITITPSTNDPVLATNTASPTSTEETEESPHTRPDRLPIILGSISGVLALFVIGLVGWFVYARYRRRKRKRASQANWDHFYKWKNRYSSGSISKVEELEEETLEEGKTPWPEPQVGNHRRTISAQFSSLRHSISKRSSIKPSPGTNSVVPSGGISNDASATKANFAAVVPPTPLPVYHQPGTTNIPSAQELFVPQFYHPHQPTSPLFAHNTFDDILRGGLSPNPHAILPRHQDRQ